MTFGELKTYLARVSHRSDLTADLPQFVEDARLAINRRFSLQLVAFTSDADTNDVLTDFPDLYQLAALRSLFEFLNDGTNAQYYDSRFERACAGQNINAASSCTDAFATEPPQITITEG